MRNPFMLRSTHEKAMTRRGINDDNIRGAIIDVREDLLDYKTGILHSPHTYRLLEGTINRLDDAYNYLCAMNRIKS